MISEERLRIALDIYTEARMAALPDPKDCYHQFSPRFERKMRKVFRIAKYPVAYKALQRAACLLLVLLALLGSIIAVNPEARAAVINWVKEQFGQFTHYYHSGETTPEPIERTQYELGWLPEGYVLLDSVPGENSEALVYINESNQFIQFQYFFAASDGPFIGGKEYTHKTILLGSYTADLYLPLNANSGSVIVWTDPESKMLFYISAFATEEDLVQMATGISENKK